MMNAIWAALCGIGLVWGMLNGRSAQLGEAAMRSGIDAVKLAITLAGGFALWNGMLSVLEQSGALRVATRLLSPALSWLFPGLDRKHPAREAIAANLAANLLGLGNAATPAGLRAMRLLGKDETDTVAMFLVVNASSVQLFPSTVIALRAAAGSVSPASVALPTLLATGVSTLVGVFAYRLLRRV